MISTANGVAPAELRTPVTRATLPRRKWLVQTPDPVAVRALADVLRISTVTASALVNRGFSARDADAARSFLRPTLKDLHEPTTVPGVEAAAERIAQAVRDGERVAIYGDYDVDGVTATAILWHALVTLDHPAEKIISYIPHRIDEGYGLHAEAMDELAAKDVTLVISVDCGITAVEPAARAAELGLDLILTDHHEWTRDADGEAVLPATQWLVHPRLPGAAASPNGDLVGAGVAFKLAWQVGKCLAGGGRVNGPMKSFLVDALALAALGTVADVGPLTGENRAIVSHGLGGLTKTRLAGLRALIDSAGLGGQSVDSFDVGFKLGPRLNACGRMGHAREAVEMLTTATPERARLIADELEQKNRGRQSTQRSIVRDAEELVRSNGWDGDGHRAIVLCGDGWHAGVVGIVASRLVDQFHRPCVVLSHDVETGIASGSARSIDGFHLAEALAACDELLDGHGGHAAAAGLRLKIENVETFRRKFAEVAAAKLSADDLRPVLRVDAEIEASDVSAALAKELARLGPFGRANPRPIVALREVSLLKANACGKEDAHLQIKLDAGAGRLLKGIAFGFGGESGRFRAGDAVDVAGEVTLSEWNGRQYAELMVRDLAPA